MHASHVAILVLAASAASPVFSAPLAARGTTGAPTTSDVVARGFPASLFSNVNKGTTTIKRDGLVDDFEARGFDPSLFSNVNKGTKAARAPNPDPKEIAGIARNLADLLSRDDLDDFVQGIARRDHDVSDSDPHEALARAFPAAIGALDDFLADHGFPRPNRLINRVRSRDLEDPFLQTISRRGIFNAIIKAIKAITGSKKVAGRDVTPEQLIALALLASPPLESLD
ncbi:hypothetical protein H4582DRAFT_1054149 [Lactarius indigo]|nr:hypothetical protein H4582DRAFT_1054149 [Lactarius indigo]